MDVLDLRFAESAGSGEPGGSEGGLGALSTSGSGSRGMEGPLETPENNMRVDAIFLSPKGLLELHQWFSNCGTSKTGGT